MSMLFDMEPSSLSRQMHKTVCCARISAMLARRTANDAIILAMLAQRGANAITEMNNTASDNDVYWYIDRTPDYHIDAYIHREDGLSTAHYERDSIYIICKNIEISEEQKNCCVCIETLEKDEICRFNCGHTLCGNCINNIMKTQLNISCPLCRTNITNIIVQKKTIQENLLETLR
jgi:hypothetical protein